MADRLLGIVVSGHNGKALESVLRHDAVEAAWCVWTGNDLSVHNALVDAGAVEPLLDLLEQRFGPDERFRATLVSLVAALPRPVEVKSAEEQPDLGQRRVVPGHLEEVEAGAAVVQAVPRPPTRTS